MFPGRCLSLCWTLLSVCQMVSSSPGQINITAEPGQTVSLSCKALNNEPVTVVDWRRIDVQPEQDVLLYRDDQFDPDYQHPSSKNRVDLQDRQMKDGDVSLILKNVTTDDSGTYACRVVQTKTNRRKRAAPVRSIIRLDVVSPGQTSEHKENGGGKEGGDKEGGDMEGLSRGYLGLIAVVVVVVVVVSLVVAVYLITIRNRKKKSSPPSSSSLVPPVESSDHLLA